MDCAVPFRLRVLKGNCADRAYICVHLCPPQLEKKERKRLKKEAKLAEAAKALEHKAAAEMGDVSLAATAAGDVTNADASVLSVNGHGHGSGDADEAERKRLKKEAKAAKKAKKAAA